MKKLLENFVIRFLDIKRSFFFMVENMNRVLLFEKLLKK